MVRLSRFRPAAEEVRSKSPAVVRRRAGSRQERHNDVEGYSGPLSKVLSHGIREAAVAVALG